MQISAEQDIRPSAEEVGRYIYCVIEAREPHDFGPIGIGTGSRVYTVHHQNLAAVVSDTPIRIYDPTRENVLARIADELETAYGWTAGRSRGEIVAAIGAACPPLSTQARAGD